MEVKATVISPANAIINPRTVMVVAFDTSVANVAVAALGKANNFAEGAETFSVKSL